MDAACEHIDERLTPTTRLYPRSDQGRHPPADGDKDGTYPQIQLRQGRGTDSTHAKGHRGDRLPSGKHRGIYRRLVPYVEGQVRQSLPRRTELRNFDTIEATKVIEANEKLYINREEGFIGTGLKKDEFIGNCSPIDDVIIFFRDGKYIITPMGRQEVRGQEYTLCQHF